MGVNDFTAADRVKVLASVNSGRHRFDVAGDWGCSHSTICRVLKQTPGYLHKGRGGSRRGGYSPHTLRLARAVQAVKRAHPDLPNQVIGASEHLKLTGARVQQLSKIDLLPAMAAAGN